MFSRQVVLAGMPRSQGPAALWCVLLLSAGALGQKGRKIPPHNAPDVKPLSGVPRDIEAEQERAAKASDIASERKDKAFAVEAEKQEKTHLAVKMREEYRQKTPQVAIGPPEHQEESNIKYLVRKLRNEEAKVRAEVSSHKQTMKKLQEVQQKLKSVRAGVMNHPKLREAFLFVFGGEEFAGSLIGRDAVLTPTVKEL